MASLHPGEHTRLGRARSRLGTVRSRLSRSPSSVVLGGAALAVGLSSLLVVGVRGSVVLTVAVVVVCLVLRVSLDRAAARTDVRVAGLADDVAALAAAVASLRLEQAGLADSRAVDRLRVRAEGLAQDNETIKGLLTDLRLDTVTARPSSP